MVGSSPAHFFKKSTDLRNWPVFRGPRSLNRFTSSNLPRTSGIDFRRKSGSRPLAATARPRLADPSNSHSVSTYRSEATNHSENRWDNSKESARACPGGRATAASFGELLGTTFSSARSLFNHTHCDVGAPAEPAGKEKPSATSDFLTACASHRKPCERAPTMVPSCPPKRS